MKYFICALGNIYLGFPAEQTQQIIPVERFQTRVFETETEKTFVSMPALFHQNDAAVHGLVLKSNTADSNKIILLTPKIDIDLEIPEENIHRLPDVFGGMFSFFRGACFAELQKTQMILVLDSEKLVNKIESEAQET